MDLPVLIAMATSGSPTTIPVPIAKEFLIVNALSILKKKVFRKNMTNLEPQK